MKTYEFRVAQTIVGRGWSSVRPKNLDEAEEKVLDLISKEGLDAVKWQLANALDFVRDADVFDGPELVRTIDVMM